MKPFARFVLRSALGLIALLTVGARQAHAVTSAPVVLAVNYACADPSPHIGSTVTVYMMALTGTTQLNLTYFSNSVTQVALTGTELATLPSQTVYVTDGVRVWAMNSFTTGGLVLLNASTLVQGGAPPFAVTDYTALVNQSFRCYVGAPLLPGTGVSLYADIATYDSVQVYDDALSIHGDQNFQDGVWSGLYTVTEFNFQVSAARLYGWAVNGAETGNSPFQSAVTIDIDAVRPAIDTYKFTTTKPQYNGMLYIASTCFGSNTPAPTNGQGRFDVTVNKRDTIVDIQLQTTPARNLPPLVFPTGATNLNGWKAWNGDDGNGKFVADGVYQAKMYIHDANNVVGLTKSAQVVVTSLKLEITNVQFSPPFRQTFPALTSADILTSVTYNITLSNESLTGIGTAMANIGWSGVTDFNGGIGSGCPLFAASTLPACTTGSLSSLPFVQPNIRFISPSGADVITYSGHDRYPNSDEDEDWIVFSRYSNYPNRPGECFRSGLLFPNPGALPPVPGDYSSFWNVTGVTNTVGDIAWVGDGTKTNDISDVQRLTPTGSISDPTALTAADGYSFFATSFSPGNLRLVINTKVTGIGPFYIGNAPATPDITDYCAPAGGVAKYRGQKMHFIEDGRGFGLSAVDSSAVFSIVTSLPPTSDSSPPFVVTSSPIDQSVVGPNVYGGASGADIAVTVQDFETPVKISPDVTLVRLFDSNNNEVLGNHTTSGGAPDNSVVVKLHPLVPIKKGGIYKVTVYACNTGGLCLQKDLAFTIQDQTAPYVPTTGVELFSSTVSGAITLATNQSSPEGPFDNITNVNVTLAMDPASSNSIDWPSSNVSVYQILTYGAKVAVPMTRLTTGTPSDSKLKYVLLSPIATAGKFEVDIQTFSKDSTGQAFSGPEIPLNPQFFTVVNPLAINIPFTNNPTNDYAVTGVRPVTITSGILPVSLASVLAFLPTLSSLPSDPGFTHLQPAADNHQAVQFSYGSGPTLLPLTWLSASPVTVKLYYNDSDLPTGLQEASLLVRGYDGSAWQTVVAQQQALTATGNTFSIALPNGSAAMSVYAIGFASGLTAVAGAATPTPLAFRSTRSFNPAAVNPINRKARFYYSSVMPKEVEVAVYDTAGNLICKKSLNSGVSLSDAVTDPNDLRTSYFFEWDGRNDNGDSVKNGLYLVRWRYTAIDNSSDTQVKAVALIK